MYTQDSFFDLSPLGQFGLACLSLTLFALVFAVARVVLWRRPAWLRVAGALGFFWAFVWLSPQVYYTYYWFLFTDLPVQWVIKPPVSVAKIIELLTFQGRQNLAAHGQALMGWALMGAAVFQWPKR
ncbi:MAG: hypothetical protein ABJH45_01360 [Paracoccaceae bacterium]|uniref:hypothetical protein n=1 Tax=Shimia thalassica TaxID=1715693 RepID=UPI003298F548